MAESLTPSMSIVKSAAPQRVTDSNGHVIEWKKLGPLDHMRLARAAKDDSGNNAWMNFARLAYSITAIDGVPIPKATTVAQLESIIERLGDSGIEAIVDAMMAETAADTVDVSVPLA